MGGVGGRRLPDVTGMRLFNAAKLKHAHVAPRSLALFVIATILLVPAAAAGDRGIFRNSDGTARASGAKTTLAKKKKAKKSSRKASVLRAKRAIDSTVEVVGSSSSTISLNWDSVDNASKYIVTRNGNVALTTRRSEASVGSLSCGSVYRLKVDVVRRGGLDTLGELLASTVSCAPAGDTANGGTQTPVGSVVDSVAPSLPPGLGKTAATTTSVSIAWGAATDNVGVAGYGVYVNGAQVGTQGGRSFSLGSLACETSRTLAVDAVDAAGNRSARASIAVATLDCPPSTTTPPPPSTTTPPPPSGSSVSCDAVASPGAGTAQALLGKLSAGQTGCLRGGTYVPSGVYVLDLSKAGVTLVSYPGERAVLQGLIVNRKGANGVRLANLRIEGQAGVSNSIQVYGADFVLENSDVTNGWRGRSCMILGDPSAGAAVRPVIRGNRFHECGTPSNGNQDHAIYASLVSDGLITGNVFWNTAAYAIQLYPNSRNTVVSHNVVDGGGSVRGGVIFGGDSGTPSSGNTVEFNVISYAATYNIESWWGGSVGSGNVARNNCVYGGAQGNVGSTVGFSSQGNQAINPLFVNRAARDYRLQSGSGCVAVVGYDAAARIG